jgi:hypothetical protein
MNTWKREIHYNRKVQGSIKMNFCRTETRVNANIRGITKPDPSQDRIIPHVVLAHIIYAKKKRVPASCGAQNARIKLISIYRGCQKKCTHILRYYGSNCVYIFWHSVYFHMLHRAWKIIAAE